MNRYEQFADLLLRWNTVHNLSGAKSRREVMDNIDDSLHPKAYLQDARTVLDIGSGAGFPGLILAMACPDTAFTLCEPAGKKASFLKTAVRKLGLQNVTVAPKRVQEIEGVFDCIVSRAVARVEVLLEISRERSGPGTCYLLYKGSEVESELEGLSLDYTISSYNMRKYLFIKATDA